MPTEKDLIDREAFAEYRAASLAHWQTMARERKAQEAMEKRLRAETRRLVRAAQRAALAVDKHCCQSWIGGHGWIMIDHAEWRAIPMVTLRAGVSGVRQEWQIVLADGDESLLMAKDFGTVWAGCQPIRNAYGANYKKACGEWDRARKEV